MVVEEVGVVVEEEEVVVEEAVVEEEVVVEEGEEVVVVEEEEVVVEEGEGEEGEVEKKYRVLKVQAQVRVGNSHQDIHLNNDESIQEDKVLVEEELIQLIW